MGPDPDGSGPDLAAARPELDGLEPGPEGFGEVGTAAAVRRNRRRWGDTAPCDLPGPGQGLSGDSYLVIELRKNYKVHRDSSFAESASKLPKGKLHNNYTECNCCVMFFHVDNLGAILAKPKNLRIS